MTKSPPRYLHTVSDQIMEGGRPGNKPGSISDSLGMGRAQVCCAEGESTIRLQQAVGCEKPFAVLKLNWNPNYSGVFGV